MIIGTMAVPVIASAAGVAAVAAGYQCMAPEGQWWGETYTGAALGRKQLALTYDDGPNDPHTQKLLEVLARHNVHATFFLIGRYVRQRPDIVREILQAGHSIGNHTFNHSNLIFAPAERTRLELRQCQEAVADVTGQQSRLFRPPFGGRRPATLRIARSMGLTPIMWNVTGWDWNAPPAEVIEQKVSGQIRGGSVILLHDGGSKAMGADRSQTVLATEKLLEKYKLENYEFVTIPSK